MPASTWTWKSGSGPSNVASNWTLTAGTGNANGIPQPGDLAIVPSGTITDGLGELAGHGTLDIINTGTVSVTVPGDGISVGNTAATSGSVIVAGTKAVLALAATTNGVAIGAVGTGAMSVLNGGSAHTPTMVLGGALTGPGGGSGTLTVSGTSDVEVTSLLALWGNSTLAVDATSGIDIGPSNTFAAGAVGIEAGTTLIGNGAVAASVVNNGIIDVTNSASLTTSNGGKLTVTGSIGGTGTINIAPGATLQIQGSLGAGQTINFLHGAPETLMLSVPSATITNAITGFGVGDRIEFPNGITVDDAFGGGHSLTIDYHDAFGTPGTTILNNITFAPNTPQSFVGRTDPFTNDVYVMPTRFFDWNGNDSTSFGDAANWNLGIQIPGPFDFATFSLSPGGTISGTGKAFQLEFANAATWSLASGTSLTATFGVVVGSSSGVSAVTIGTGATVVSAGSIGVGGPPGTAGDLIVSGGGVLRDTAQPSPTGYFMRIADAAAFGTLAAPTGSVTVTGAGSLIDLGSNALVLGNNGGNASLTIMQGGSVNAAAVNANLYDSVAIGRRGTATLTVTDPGSQLTATGVVAVALGGTGTLTVQNQGTVRALTNATGQVGIIIGSGDTQGIAGAGVANILSGGNLISQGSVVVGSFGTFGQLNVNDGTVRAGTSISMGVGGTIAPDTTEGGTIEPGNGTLSIGAGGTVLLTGAAQTATYGVTIGDSNVGTGSAETGVAIVGGTGALLNTNGNGLAVGQFGSGNLTVSQGGSVASGTPDSNAIAALAVGREGSGTVTVSGTGARLSTTGGASVGLAGAGSLIVQNQGSVSIGLDPNKAGGLRIGGAGTNPGGTLWVGGSGTVSIGSGGSLFSQADISVGQNGAAGTLTVQPGGTAEAAGRLIIGDSTTLGSGATLISPAGTTAVTLTTVESGSGLVTIAAGGVLKVDGAGITTAGTAAVIVSDGFGSAGLLTLSGAGAMLDTNFHAIQIGAAGQGTVTVSQGSTVLAGTKFANDAALTVGGAGVGASSLTVTDTGSRIIASGQINVGGAGTELLLVQNQATIVSGGSSFDPSQGFDIAQVSGGSGGVIVSGTRSLINNAGRFVVGDAGVGALTILLGGSVITSPGAVDGLAGLVIAGSAAAAGSTVNISGTGSRLDVTGLLDVGAGGSGGLLLSGGATVTAGSLEAGNVASSVGQIGLTGAGTSLIVSGNATVADDGTGVLSVLSGATFAATNLTIGNTGNSSGVLVVSGAGSEINLSGALNIGTALGTGDLTVGPGAAVHASVVNLQGQVVLEGGLLDPTVNLIGQGQTAGGFGTISADDIIDEGVIQAGGTKPSQKLLIVQGTVVGGGTLTINGTVQGSNPAGVLQINAGGTMELTGPVLNAATTTFTDNLTPAGTYTVNNSVIDVTFADAAGVLLLDDIARFGGTITSFKSGDSFVITGGTLSNVGVNNGNTLTFADSGTGARAGGIDQIIFGSAVNAGQFSIVNGNTVQAVACFAAGTRIGTADGPVAVDRLRVGDRVLTADGRIEPVIWIGSRAVDCARHPKPETVRPVRVRGGAFGENVPVRDLHLSPDHAVFVNDALVPVKLLVNGTSITQMKRAKVTYYHVELARHEVILAEGLTVESYLDLGDRADFTDGGAVIRLFPDFMARLAPDTARVWETSGAAPLVMAGDALDRARRAVRTPPRGPVSRLGKVTRDLAR